MNAPPLASRLMFALIIALVAVGPLSTDLYLPSLPAIGRDLAADVAGTQLTLSIYMVAFAVAQLAYGPLSDRFGRRPIVLAGIAIYTAASIACAFATTIDQPPPTSSSEPAATPIRRRRSTTSRIAKAVPSSRARAMLFRGRGQPSARGRRRACRAASAAPLPR